MTRISLALLGFPPKAGSPAMIYLACVPQEEMFAVFCDQIFLRKHAFLLMRIRKILQTPKKNRTHQDGYLMNISSSDLTTLYKLVYQYLYNWLYRG